MAAQETLKTYNGSVYTLKFLKDKTVLMEDTGRISAKDGWKTALIPGLASERTRQNVAVLRFMLGQNLPVAFIEQVNDTTIRQHACDMMAGEFVVRRHLIGSYLERHPQMQPQRSDALVAELFAKRALRVPEVGEPVWVDGNLLRREFTERANGDAAKGWALLEKELKQKRVFMDPYVEYREGEWAVFDAHATLKRTVPVHYDEPPFPETMGQRGLGFARRVFTDLEQGLERIDCDLVGVPGLERLVLADGKFEFGRPLDPKQGSLLLTDVVCLDNIRLLINGGYDKVAQLSKQTYRDSEDNSEAMHARVMQTYRYGTAALTQLAA